MLVRSGVRRAGWAAATVRTAVRAARYAHTTSDADVVIVGGGVVGLAMLAGLGALCVG